jgi:hypothetical protein
VGGFTSYPQAKRPHLQSLYCTSRPDRDSTEEKRANDICVSTKTESDSVGNGVKVRNRGRASPKLQVREPGTDVETVSLRLRPQHLLSPGLIDSDAPGRNRNSSCNGNCSMRLSPSWALDSRTSHDVRLRFRGVACPILGTERRQLKQALIF